MAERAIYFVKHGLLFKKTVDVTWSPDCMKTNKLLCSEEIFEKSDKWLRPCIDVSYASSIYGTKRFSVYSVHDDEDKSIKELWDLLDNSFDSNTLPPGSKDLIYMMSLKTEDAAYALSVRSFYDSVYNPKSGGATPAIALCALQLLYHQNKMDYLTDMHKFLWWYWVNCRRPTEYNEKYEELYGG